MVAGAGRPPDGSGTRSSRTHPPPGTTAGPARGGAAPCAVRWWRRVRCWSIRRIRQGAAGRLDAGNLDDDDKWSGGYYELAIDVGRQDAGDIDVWVELTLQTILSDPRLGNGEDGHPGQARGLPRCPAGPGSSTPPAWCGSGRTTRRTSTSSRTCGCRSTSPWAPSVGWRPPAAIPPSADARTAGGTLVPDPARRANDSWDPHGYVWIR